MEQWKDALAMIRNLPESDREKLIQALSTIFIPNKTSTEAFLTKERFSEGRFCPHCGHAHVVRNGHRKDGTQRYVCKGCGKSFVASSNSILFSTKKELAVWQKYINCMMHGFTVRKTATICGISINTSFFWRHKILDALQEKTMNDTISGIVEADETFFPLSYKGNHKNSTTFKMPRKSHKRGKSIHTRGLSHEQVCVPCSINRSGKSMAKVANLGKATRKSLKAVYKGKIEERSILCTDKLQGYRSMACEMGINLIQIKAGKTIAKGIYTLQHINQYHSGLKGFLYVFHGVSTKYLNNYLVWNNTVAVGSAIPAEKERAFGSFVFSVRKTVRKRSYANRSPVPVIC